MQSSEVNAMLDRFRGFRRAAGLSRSAFALRAGLSRSALSGIEHPDWSPTADTLRALEAVVPDDWQPGDPVQAGDPVGDAAGTTEGAS